MAKPVEFNIYIGKTGTPQRPPKPFVIPEKWKPILALAYAYTTDSIYNAGIDLANLQNTVSQHTQQINDIADTIAVLLADENIIPAIEQLAAKIDRIDPDLLLGLAYIYTDVQDEIYLAYSYSYSHSLYDSAMSYSYAYTSSVGNMLQSDLDELSNKIINEYVTYSYANATYARKNDIPTKLSDLTNDKEYITQSNLNNALEDYTTYNYVNTFVDDRINSVVDAAPEALDTLKELAYALNNDKDFGPTVINQLNQKANLSDVQEMFDTMIEQKDDIPIYDESKIEELGGRLPEKYIQVRSPESLYQSPPNSHTNLEIIFSTLRKLQQEVSRLQRTLDKGIISMTGEYTRMSQVSSEYFNIPAEEPLWAVDPDSLTEITGAEFYTDNAHVLTPAENVLVDGTKLVINENGAFWNDNRRDITSGEVTNYLYNNTDSKQYVYITSSYPNIKIYLTNYEDDENQMVIDLANLKNKPIPRNVTNKYNTLLCVSRAVTYDKINYCSYNYSFLSVGDYYEGRTIIDGYVKNNFVWDSFDAGQFGINTNANKKNNRYYISQIEFNDVELYRMAFYSKFQEFTHDVQPLIPDDDDTYSVAHITIRSVKSIEQLKKIKDQLLENELIYNDSNNCLYIIKNNEIKLISGGSSNIDPSDDTNTGMEKQEILEWLHANGIIVTENGGDTLSLNNVGDITFINQLNERYKYTIDTDGNLKGTRVNDETFADKLAKVPDMVVEDKVLATISEEDRPRIKNTRGFIGTYNEYTCDPVNPKKTGAGDKNVDEDMGLYSDRIKIGNIYAPWKENKTYGCTHGYIELENSSNIDYPLDGFYLHFVRRLPKEDPNSQLDGEVQEYSLPLSGVIPAGGTYLVRCKQYSTIEQSNTFIDVDSFDIEWVTADEVDEEGNITKKGELLDLYLSEQNTFLLTYGCPGKDRVKKFVITNDDGTEQEIKNGFDYHTTMIKKGSESFNKGYYIYHSCYVDSVSINANIDGDDSKDNILYTWCGWDGNKGIYKNANKLDAIYKTTFELDPAKQAYQSLHWSTETGSGKDSSRVRSNTGTDYQVVTLEKEYIEFPHSNEKYPVAMYKPMASYLHKNVCTDKTKLDMNKPNMPTVAFGINMFTTRTFNWISAGYFNEYVWIKPQTAQGSWTTWKKFESYKTVSDTDTTYDTYRTKINNNTLTAPYRKEFTYITNNAVYARIQGSLPGTGSTIEQQIKYTSHKCIVEIVNEAVNTPLVYEYVVGRADKNGNPDPEHTSEIMTFTLYPSDYEPRLYQTTDQQGFHWIEYQTWAAAAIKINEVINNQCNASGAKLIPVVLNTGDATQNGTRINEWLDYYIGGKCLFNHLEQMSIVGNNDLCDNNPEILGTGDDIGKSNGFYHHVFYCYELDEKLANVDETVEHPVYYLATNAQAKEFLNNEQGKDYNSYFKYLPVIKGTDNTIRYIPSFYWFGTDKYTFVMMNSELTEKNCSMWFNKTIMNNGEKQTVNIYTGWSITPKGSSIVPIYDNSFTTIYTMLYHVIDEHKKTKYSYETNVNNKMQNLIVACHEMPFTVVTAANLKASAIGADRSLNSSNNNLVGSHMNMINNLDKKSNYWFSRLLEYFHVKFVYGGHKHTYAITNELRENYLYDNETKSSLVNGPMPMEETLEHDTVSFDLTIKLVSNQIYDINNLQVSNSVGTDTSVKLSKFPIMNIDDDMTPAYGVPDPETGVREKLEGINYVLHNYGGTVGAVQMALPYYGVKLNAGEELGGVKYMMCQATGYKLKSNKELPGPQQRFSYIIPQTTPTATKGKTDSPSMHQLVPMFTIIDPNEHKAYLIRMINIHNGDPDQNQEPAVLSQAKYGTKPIKLQYLYKDCVPSHYNNDNNKIDTAIYGKWSTNENDVQVLLTW